MLPYFPARPELFAATLACFVALVSPSAARDRPRQDADAPRTIDWGAIPPRAVMLFYPGQSSQQWLRGEGQAPRFMFDPARTSFRALSLDQAQARSKPNALIREEHAVPYDPGHAWQVGDLLPSRVLSRTDARGSAADLRHVVGQWEAGTWTVIWVQPLNTGHPADDKPMRPGGRYTVAFSVHDDSVTTRFHHVSFPLTLGMGVEGDIAAVKLE